MSGPGDGKYELLSVADDVIADEIRNLMSRSELLVYLKCELAINLTRLLLWFLNPKTVPELTFDYFL